MARTALKARTARLEARRLPGKGALPLVVPDATSEAAIEHLAAASGLEVQRFGEFVVDCVAPGSQEVRWRPET